MFIAEITGKKGKWIRKSGFASIIVDDQEQYIGELSKGDNSFLIKDTSDEIVLAGYKNHRDIIIKKDGFELAKILAPKGFLLFQQYVEIGGEQYKLVRRNLIKLADYVFTFPMFGLRLKVEKEQIINEQDIYRGIGLGYYIWMRNDISD